METSVPMHTRFARPGAHFPAVQPPFLESLNASTTIVKEKLLRMYCYMAM